MNEYTILTNIRDAINSDAAVTAWCQTNYSVDPAIYLGIDQENPPDESEYPLIAVFPWSKESGTVREDEGFGVGLLVGVFDENRTKSGNLVEYIGIQKIIELRRLVITAAAGADFDGGMVTTVDVEYEPVEMFPLFLASNNLSIDRPYAFREERLI